ncbi:MAG: PqqD family protein [Solirubrobacteraceae bacterium]
MTLSLREQDLDWREIADEIVALDGQGGEYLAVRGSGAILWRLLAQSTTRVGLVQALVETYGIDATLAGDDVNEFLATLHERGLLNS